MSKRKRGEDEPSAKRAYDDVQNTRDKTPPGPYSYTAEKRQAIYNERGRRDDNNSKRPQLNEHFGQRNAFPEPELGEGEEEDDAIAYMRSVR